MAWVKGNETRTASITVVTSRSAQGVEYTRNISISRVNPVTMILTDDDAADVCKALIGLTKYNGTGDFKRVRLSTNYSLEESA